MSHLHWHIRVYDCIRNKSRTETVSYLRFFAGNLDLLEEDQREATVTYLLSMLRDGDRNTLLPCQKWRIYRQVGQFLNSEEGLSRVFETVKGRLRDFAHAEQDDAEDIFLSIVHDQILLPKMSPDKMGAIVEMLRGLMWPEKASDWADYLEIPF